MSLGNVLTNQYSRMASYGVQSTRVYTTIGSGSVTNCNAAACTWGGAAKQLVLAASYNMTGALLVAPAKVVPQPTDSRVTHVNCRHPPAVTVGITLPPLSTGLTSFYTNSSAITAFLSTFNNTVQQLMTYPNLLMWCAAAEQCAAFACGDACVTRARRTGRWATRSHWAHRPG